eukprot:COSAG06_NODE_4950_length_3837_cov_4.204655_2_plen_162_part_00
MLLESQQRVQKPRLHLLWLLPLLAVVTTAGAQTRFQHNYEKHDLAKAAEEGDLATVHALLDGEVNVDLKDPSGRTALHHAARMGHVHVLEALLERGADTEARTATGYTALHEASMHDQFGSARVLLENGADKEAKTSGGHGVLTFGQQEFKEKFKKHTEEL